MYTHAARAALALWLVLSALLAAWPRALDRGEVVGPYIRPAFARQMRELRPAILEAARRHNRPELSGMSDTEFAAAIALVLYNEHFGWLEDAFAPLRPFTPLYQQAQLALNDTQGTNFSVWPSNLRPSVALEIRRQELPLPAPRPPMRVPVRVVGSRVDLRAYATERELYAALNAEISEPAMAVEYLAANLERGVYRARYEGVPVTWEALAAWHNQGIVAPGDIAGNPTARDYIRRAAAYRIAALALVGDAEDAARAKAGAGSCAGLCACETFGAGYSCASSEADASARRARTSARSAR